jgi:hypothetical protein
MSERRAIQRRLDSYKRRLYRGFDEGDIWSAIDRKSLDLAGRFFRANLANPAARDMLLHILADALFGSGKKGRPTGSHTAWDIPRLFGCLLPLYYEKKRDNPKLSQAKIAKLICEHEEFRYNDPEQVRQHLGLALQVVADLRRYTNELARTSSDRGDSSSV